MMNFDEFKRQVESIIQKKVIGAKVEMHKVVKNNSVELTGLSIVSDEVEASPCIYLEEFYADLCSGKSLSQIVDEIWNFYQENKVEECVDTSVFTDWEQAKQRVVCKLINYNENKDLLKQIPHKKFLNLAEVYIYIWGKHEQAIGTVLIKNVHMNLWGITQDELKEVAYRNYELICDSSVETMDNIFHRCFDEIEEEQQEISVHMYVVTNQLKLNGATSLLFPEIFKKISDVYKSDLYILPSSLHEVIALPKIENNALELKEMVMEVNSTMVKKEERLSDSVYCYLREV